ARFFFSSRRRHTRFSRDWSSDVCSSDLQVLRAAFDEARLFCEGVQRHKALRDIVLGGGLDCGRGAEYPGDVLEPSDIALRDLMRSEERRVGRGEARGGARLIRTATVGS